MPKQKSPKSADDILQWLLAQLADHLGIQPGTIDPDREIADLGLSSLQATMIAGDLELWLGDRKIDPPQIGLAKSARSLAETLAGARELSPDEKPESNLDNLDLSKLVQEQVSTLAQRIEGSASFWKPMLDSGLFSRQLLSPNDRTVKILDPFSGKPKDMIMMGSNNYLGLANHPHVKQRSKQAIDEFGTGMAGPYLLNGMSVLHRELEERLAKLKHAEDSMIFATGYQTNLGWVAGLLRNGDVLVYDEFSHASFYDALKMAQGYAPASRSFAFRHNDPKHLKEVLAGLVSEKIGQIFVAIEGVYSMHGDIAPLPEIRDVCDEFGALLVVDDAHGTLVLGKTGGGIAEHFGMENKVDISIGTFSKSFTSTGGFIASSKKIIEYLRVFSRPHMFSAHVAPSTAGTVLGCLDVVEREPERLVRLRENVSYIVKALNLAGFALTGECPILPILIPMGTDIRAFAKEIHEGGIFLNTVMYPAVPKDQQRLRMNIMASHTREDLDKAAEVLIRAALHHGVISRKAA